MVPVRTLIISTSLDFATDLICLQLSKRKTSYLRLNRDQLAEYKIILNPSLPELIVYFDNLSYLVSSESLASIYFRAPTFLREIFNDEYSEDEQLYKTQWAAFVRSLIVFENAKWINHPVDTYKAEMKPFQLFHASKIGFSLPASIITNHILKEHLSSENIAIKSIDTAIINKGNQEAFIYTTIVKATEVKIQQYDSPFLLQEGLIPKIDIRVTVIGKTVIAVKIQAENGIDIDWRNFKGILTYELFHLPKDIENKCIEFVESLNLIFGAIDLILYQEKYFFIEINPTGEWAWLQRHIEYPFDRIIADNLI